MTLVHINRPSGHYIGQVRKAGHRLWQTVTKHECQSPEVALGFVASNMAGMKRGRVLFIAECGYYEPNLIMEVKRA